MSDKNSGGIAARSFIARLAAHWVVFPAMALLVLCIVWGTTFHLLSLDRANAEKMAASSAVELADTYEAQILRNLREIDHTLKVVQYAWSRGDGRTVLGDLRSKALLPHDLLFNLAVIDNGGRMLESSGPVPRRLVDVARRLSAAMPADVLWVGREREGERPGEWKLDFGRRIVDAKGRPAGSVILSVDAAYFVSSYEAAKLGARGVLALVGKDDAEFRVRRTGETVSAGDRATLGAAADEATPSVGVLRQASAWDGERRFTAVRPLFDFPLTVVVGLSEAEQLAASDERRAWYKRLAALASVVLVVFIGLLGTASWKLARASRREAQAQIAHAERVQYLAYHDNLSGLPNRALFSRMLEQSITEARRYGRQLAVLFLDLDRFKQINDTLGHHAGDELLTELARRLRSALRGSDMVARLGGDEFVVLLPQFDSERHVLSVASKLLAVVAEPFEYRGHRLVVTTSIGVAVFPRDGTDEQMLMKCADAAMYHAKGEGKNNCQFYSTKLQENSLRRLALESSLRRALQQREFELQYQPKVSLASGRITGAEALLRWRSPEHGLVSPADFIPIAEETGLIVPIGLWVLEAACAQGVAWRRSGLPPVCVAVNMSARQFADGNLADEIAAILRRTGIDPALLELEITESLIMTNLERSVQTLSRLSDAGFRLAIDDFGTGYSSLSNLKRFPLTTLKIDRSFISELPHDADGRVITEAIIAMGKALGLRVVAEGAERAEQVRYLRQQGCDEYQGYYFSKPVGADELAALLATDAAISQSIRTARSSP